MPLFAQTGESCLDFVVFEKKPLCPGFLSVLYLALTRLYLGRIRKVELDFFSISRHENVRLYLFRYLCN